MSRPHSTEQRERQILDAAVRVFAERGYHAARVSDIAREAGVAYGLVYHYFPTKEALLEQIFERTWGQLSQGLDSIVSSQADARQQLAEVVRLMLGSYRMAPELVRVLILEVTRSGHLREQVHEIRRAFETIESIIARGQRDGELRADMDARLVSYVFWGAIEELLTGWVFDTLPSGDGDVAQAEQTVVTLVLEGLAGA